MEENVRENKATEAVDEKKNNDFNPIARIEELETKLRITEKDVTYYRDKWLECEKRLEKARDQMKSILILGSSILDQ